jgi:hypothetical protein
VSHIEEQFLASRATSRLVRAMIVLLEFDSVLTHQLLALGARRDVDWVAFDVLVPVAWDEIVSPSVGAVVGWITRAEWVLANAVLCAASVASHGSH